LFGLVWDVKLPTKEARELARNGMGRRATLAKA